MKSTIVPSLTYQQVLTLAFFFITFTINNNNIVSTAKILSVNFVSTKSHEITYELLIAELAKRGHELTLLTPYLKLNTSKNIHQIKTISLDELQENIPNRFEMKEKGEVMGMNPFQAIQFMQDLCKRCYELPEIQTLLKTKPSSYDLILWLGIMNECSSGFVHKMNAPTILISPVSLLNWQASVLGNPIPISFIPNIFSSFSDKMTFIERIKNFLLEFIGIGGLKLFMEYSMGNVPREILNDTNLPGNDEILKNVSLSLSNSHFRLNFPRPFLPDVIEVGGMHCRKAKPLPKDLEDFVSSKSAPDGFIYFSMGSSLRGDKMPDKRRKIILAAFGKLKQKILWKWESETMPDLPSNVRLIKWAPQQDILGHKNLRAFMTHGGLGSVTESAFHAIPMFGDQELNVEKAVNQGFAVRLDFVTMTTEDILDALQKVMTDPMYKNNVDRLSSLYQDQIDKPLDRAVFWTEYVIRHKGAPHLRSAARDLNFFQYHSLDVIATLLLVKFLVLYLSFILLRFLFRKICGCCKSKSTSSTTKKTN